MLRARQIVGKYRILRRIASGPLADVYRAFDTIHKTHVALKIPKSGNHTGDEDFLREVQVAAKLKHPNILSVLNASYIDDYFVIAVELGQESLADRLERRISTARALDLAGQALAALAHAHEHRIIHCDIKPENFILFADNQLKLADFGFAKLSLRTLKASGSGTIDYIAPEQAMGRPKFQSDVFSMGLVLYRLFSGKLPEWPFDWPAVGHERLLKRVRPEFAEMLRKAIQIDPARRYRDAIQMQAEFERLQAMLAGRSVPRQRTAVAAGPPGDNFSGASFRGHTARHFTLFTVVAIARDLCPTACRLARGAASTIRREVQNHRCRPAVHDVSAASRTTGITVRGATGPDSSRKRTAVIPTSATRHAAEISDVAVR